MPAVRRPSAQSAFASFVAGRTLSAASATSLALVLTGTGFGCAKAKEEPRAQPEASVAADTPHPASHDSGPHTAATGPVEPIVTIPDKLRFEAKHRGEGAVRAEDVYAAFEKGGLPVTERAQHVASVFGAKFCMGAAVEGDVKLSVCEYATPEAAKTSRDESAKLLASIPNREVVASKFTTLTIRQPTVKTPKSEASAKKVKTIFAAL